MPVYPALILLAALGFRELLRHKASRMLPLALAGFCALEAINASPSQLAYFSPLYGGSANASRHLVDSSLDWGQELWNLKGALEREGIKTDGSEKLYIGYFGGLPASDCGLPAKILPFPMNDQFNPKRFEFEPGVYCISATLLRGANLPFTDTRIFGSPQALARLSSAFYDFKRFQDADDVEGMKKALAAYGDGFVSACIQYELLRFEALRRKLLKMEPVASVGSSILIFRLDEQALREGLDPAFLPAAKTGP